MNMSNLPCNSMTPMITLNIFCSLESGENKYDILKIWGIYWHFYVRVLMHLIHPTQLTDAVFGRLCPATADILDHIYVPGSL
jgi:hypothetical protein